MVGIITGGFGLAACSGCKSPPEQAPASGADAGAPEGAVADAARDVGYLETDLLPADQWAPIPGLPQECGERIALDPNTAVPKLDWKPCSAKWGPGCKRVDNTWSKWPYGALGGGPDEPIRRVNGTIRISYIRTEWKDNIHFDRSYSVIEDAQGRRQAAMGVAPAKSGLECSGRVYLGKDGVAAAAAGRAGRTQEFLAVGPRSLPPKLTAHVTPLVDFEITDPSLVTLGTRGHVFYSGDPPSTAIYDPSNRKLSIPKTDGAKLLDVFPYVAADEGVLTIGYDGAGYPLRVGYMAPDGTHSPLFQSSAQHYLTGLTLDRGVDPPQIVWTEARNEGGLFASTELWTSPFAMTAAGIAKRLVAKDDFGPGFGFVYLSADRGRALFRNGTHSARLVRLADGMGWSLTADPGEAFTEIAGLADDDAWLFVTQEDPKVQNLPRETAILRARFDDLGPPTVPRGF
jgi:hypothetical protein